MADRMLNKLQHHWNVSSRREFFTQAGSGLAKDLWMAGIGIGLIVDAALSESKVTNTEE